MTELRNERSALSPLLFFRRNRAKTIPLVSTIVLAVVLIISIVSMMNSIPESVRTIYRYSKEYAGVSPRGLAEQVAPIRAAIQEEAPVKIGRIITCRVSDMVVHSIVGKWPFAILALSQEDIPFYLDRMHSRGIVGRTVQPGKPEILLSESIARNLNLKIGDVVLAPDRSDAYSPKQVVLVGIIQTDYWVAISNAEYYRENHFPPIDALAVFAEDSQQQPELDAWTLKRFTGERAKVFVYSEVEKDSNEMFRILYRILNLVIGMLVMIVTIMMGMLINIFQSQRIPEFGLLNAIGFSRKTLIRRAIFETSIVVFAGWVLGIFVAYGLLIVVKKVMFDPQAFMLNPLDKMAYFYSIPIPIAIVLVAAGSAWHTFRGLDPVSIFERRTL